MVYRHAMVLPHNELWARPQKSIHIGCQSCEKSSILLKRCCNFMRTGDVPAGERLCWAKVPMVVAWDPRCVCVCVCACVRVYVCVCVCVCVCWHVCVCPYDKWGCTWDRSVFYTKCSLPHSFLMPDHFCPGTPRVYKSWIKYTKLYVNKYYLFCVLKSSLWTKSWTHGQSHGLSLIDRDRRHRLA